MEVFIDGKKYVESSTQPTGHYTFNDILIGNTIALYSTFDPEYLGRAKVKETFGKSFENLIAKIGVVYLSDFEFDSELEQKIIETLKKNSGSLKGQIHVYKKDVSLVPVGNTNLKFNEIQPAFPIGVFNFYFDIDCDTKNDLDLKLCFCDYFRYSMNGNIEIDDIAIYQSKAKFILSDS